MLHRSLRGAPWEESTNWLVKPPLVGPGDDKQIVGYRGEVICCSLLLPTVGMAEIGHESSYGNLLGL